MVTDVNLVKTKAMDNCNEAIKQQVTINPKNRLEEEVDLHVGWGADGDFLLGCEISMASVAYNNVETCFHFHLFTNDSHRLDQEKLQQLAEQQSLIITVYSLDDGYFSQLPTNRLWSFAIYYRFILAQHLSTFTDKMLYLDADVICQGQLTSLVELQLGTAVAAVVTERENKWWSQQAERLHCPALKEGYFNSGVMLINLERWREEQILEQLLALAAQPDLQARLTFFDQDLLNLVLVDKKILLDSVYNSQYSLNYELNEAKRSTFNPNGILMHFVGPTKPWHAWAQYNSAKAFQQAKIRSPWRQDPLQLPTSTFQYRYCYKHMIKQKEILKGYGYFLRYLLRKLLSRR